MIKNIYNDDYLITKQKDDKYNKFIYIFLGLLFCISIFFSNQEGQVKNEETSILSPIIDNVIKSESNVAKKYDFFKIVMTETKRREAMGQRGRELQIYYDGDHKTIGYGCHISNLSDEWKTLIKKQGNMVSEKQARELMYNHYEQIHRAIAKDVPGLNTAQMWAVKSLTYNYGWGNVKKSKLFKLIKNKDTSNAIEREWLKTWAKTDNHKVSRKMEIALWMGNYDDAKKISSQAYNELKKRGDFKHYK